MVEAGTFEAVGEISTLREVLADGHRALVVGHADESGSSGSRSRWWRSRIWPRGRP